MNPTKPFNSPSKNFVANKITQSKPNTQNVPVKNSSITQSQITRSTRPAPDHSVLSNEKQSTNESKKMKKISELTSLELIKVLGEDKILKIADEIRKKRATQTSALPSKNLSSSNKVSIKTSQTKVENSMENIKILPTTSKMPLPPPNTEKINLLPPPPVASTDKLLPPPSTINSTLLPPPPVGSNSKLLPQGPAPIQIKSASTSSVELITNKELDTKHPNSIPFNPNDLLAQRIKLKKTVTRDVSAPILPQSASGSALSSSNKLESNNGSLNNSNNLQMPLSTSGPINLQAILSARASLRKSTPVGDKDLNVNNSSSPRRQSAPALIKRKDDIRVKKWFDILEKKSVPRFMLEIQMKNESINPQILASPNSPLPKNESEWKLLKKS